MQKLFLILILFISVPVGAQPFPLIRKAVKELRLKYEDCDESMMAEKALPGTKQTILVIPVVTPGEDMFNTFAYILLVDNETGKIISRAEESWDSDAIALTSIEIDAAPYFVKTGVRAFGIRTHYRNQSGANPYSHDLLNLYIPDGEKLKAVLKDFEVGMYAGETDTQCAGEFEEVESILIMATESSNGYFNLIIKDKVSKITYRPLANGDCDKQTVSRTEKRVLKFNGGKYR